MFFTEINSQPILCRERFTWRKNSCTIPLPFVEPDKKFLFRSFNIITMFLYAVTVSSRSPATSELIDLHLSVYVKAPEKLRFSENAWLIYTPNWASWVRNAVAPALRSEDQLLIVTVMQPFDGIFSSDVVRWINSRLDPYVFEPVDSVDSKVAMGKLGRVGRLEKMEFDLSAGPSISSA